jgi:hypothetical protein
MIDGVAMIEARNVMTGDLLDLEGDKFADPKGDNPFYQSEFVEVYSAEAETLDCVRIDFCNLSIGFPSDHLIGIEIEAMPLPCFYECGICGHLHPAKYTGDCRDDAFRFTTSELEDELGQPDYGWMLTDWNGYKAA